MIALAGLRMAVKPGSAAFAEVVTITGDVVLPALPAVADIVSCLDCLPKRQTKGTAG